MTRTRVHGSGEGTDRRRLPAGRQPYDPLNGLRVGAIAGALLGAVGVVAAGTGAAWLIVVGGGIGATIGYRSETRKLRRH